METSYRKAIEERDQLVMELLNHARNIRDVSNSNLGASSQLCEIDGLIIQVEQVLSSLKKKQRGVRLEQYLNSNACKIF